MTEPVLIVAHGQPSDPGPLAAEVAALARAVAGLLPGRVVGSATLAEAGALAAAVAGAPGVVYPLFMSGGWFTRVHLPKRLAEAGGAGWRVLEPMGCDPAVQALAAQIVTEAGGAGVVLAAHGSGRSPAPAAVARATAGRIAATGRAVQVAFIEEAPRLSDLPPGAPEDICLPFFAAGGEHVGRDLPQALAAAGWRGRILPPLGHDPRLPALIAAAVTRGDSACATCRWLG